MASVRVTGLDRPIVAGLPVNVAKEKPPDIAPPGFRSVWNWIRATSKKKKMSRGVLMAAGGFKRSVWFEYKRLGTIPFNKLEAMVNKLGGTISTEVVLASVSAPRVNTDSIETGTGEDDVDAELDLMLQQLDGLDDLRRGMVLGQFKAALREALASPREPVAGKGLRAPGVK